MKLLCIATTSLAGTAVTDQQRCALVKARGVIVNRQMKGSIFDF
jgi:hypothetical protein